MSKITLCFKKTKKDIKKHSCTSMKWKEHLTDIISTRVYEHGLQNWLYTVLKVISFSLAVEVADVKRLRSWANLLKWSVSKIGNSRSTYSRSLLDTTRGAETLLETWLGLLIAMKCKGNVRNYSTRSKKRQRRALLLNFCSFWDMLTLWRMQNQM